MIPTEALTFDGREGNDTINAGIGDDYIIGATGADSFQHNGYLGNGTDGCLIAMSVCNAALVFAGIFRPADQNQFLFKFMCYLCRPTLVIDGAQLRHTQDLNLF